MRKFLLTIFLIPTLLGAAMPLAHATPDGTGNEIFTGNVGIGTTTPRALFVVAGGNVGIGTWDPTSPFQVSGTITATAFAGDGGSLTGISSTTFVDDGPVVRLATSSDNMGIGTTSATNGKLLIYGGNVGIGTVNQTPSAMVEVSTLANQDLFRVDDDGDGDPSPFVIDSNGNVGIGTTITSNAALSVMNGNVGIGTWVTNEILTIKGNLMFLNNFNPKIYGTINGANDQDFVMSFSTYTVIPRNVNKGFYIDSNGNIGISTTTSPTGKLGIINGNVGIGTWTANGGGLIVRVGNVGIQTIAPGARLDIMAADNTTAQRNIINAAQASITASDHFIDFDSTTGNEASITGSGVAGVLTYNTFTGSHWTKIDDKTGLKVNMVLEATGEKFDNHKLQLVKSRVTTTRQSPAVYGVYGGTDERAGHDLVLALGTGYIWVADTNGDIAVDDYLQSSPIFGHAEKQTDDRVHNYTVAKSLEKVHWKPKEHTRLIACTYHAG